MDFSYAIIGQTNSLQLGLDIRSLSQAQLDNLLLSTVEIKNKPDFPYLIRQCVRHHQLPSSEVLLACFKYLMQLCRLQQIESLADMCKLRSHPFVKVYANFAPFKAMVLWRCGGADVALMTLHRSYGDCRETDDGRRMARNVFRIIIEETLAKKSEAFLVSLIQVAHSIYEEHNDIFVVACVWKQCFASEWFCFEEFNTLLIRIEAVLNSRPLSPMSQDPDDLQALTPGHFLRGAPLLSIPEQNVENKTLINKWQKLKVLHHQFSRRWKAEYLQELHKRYKWRTQQPNIKEGDLVVVKDDLLPPNEWRLGRITCLHPAPDQNVRVVDIRTQSGIVTRNITKLCILPPA